MNKHELLNLDLEAIYNSINKCMLSLPKKSRKYKLLAVAKLFIKLARKTKK